MVFSPFWATPRVRALAATGRRTWSVCASPYLSPRPRWHPPAPRAARGATPGEVVTSRPTAGGARRPASPASELAVSSFGEVAARVAAAGEPRWLIQGLWPADAYGVVAAQEKAGKTWATLDLAVSVASGQPWLDHFACPTPGPVLVFLGEGGERATPPHRGHRHQQGPRPPPAGRPAPAVLRVPRPVPKVTGGELAAIQAELAAHPAALVVLDPLYLAAAGGQRSQPVRHGRRPPAIQASANTPGAPAGGDPLEQDRGWPRRQTHQRRRAGCLGPGHLAQLGRSNRTGTDDDGASRVLLGWR